MSRWLNRMLSLLLLLLIVSSSVTGFTIKTNAATVDEAELGAGNDNVIDAQTWLNSTYSDRNGYTPIEVDGLSYSTTYIALVKAFQIELGFDVNNITGTFGPLTKASSPTFEINKNNNENMVRILQHGLRCKGYYETKVNGIFDERTQSQIVELQQDAGLTDSQISMKATPLVLQAALSTEIYVLASGGNTKVREVQRALNRDYLDYIGIQPCDGIFGGNTVDSLITALQANEGLPRREDVSSDDDIYANGYFGNTTRNCCPSIPYDGSVKSYGGRSYTTDEIVKFTKLFQYALYCLKPNEYNVGAFSGSLNTTTTNVIKKFQEDVALYQSGTIGLNEWMGVLVSTGNPSREGKAIDCSVRLTNEKVNALKDAGYTTVGRYLTGDLVSGGKRVAKNLLRREMKTIFDAGLNLFVIFQDPREAFFQYPNIETFGDLCEVYYTKSRGYSDAEKAFSVAKSLGVPRGEIIYFTVDYDFVKYEVDEKIIPYFEGINNYANNNGNEYKIGIYSARNTCTLVSQAGYSESSFVSDMSTGYSGNKGYPLPDDWAFDQIQEISSFYSSDGSFGIDKNVISGRYNGFNHFETEKDDERDLISKDSSVSVLIPKNSAAKPIPVFWAKTIDTLTLSYKAKYSMFDYIYPGSFVVMKNSVKNSGTIVEGVLGSPIKDSIRYVYFRDKGGNLNAGYIDSNLLKNYTVWDFEKCNIYRGDGYGDGELYPFLSANANEFVLDGNLKCYNKQCNYVDTLVSGSRIKVSSGALTNAIYPNLLEIIEFKKPNGSWVDFNGYIDLGFEQGVLPKDRVLISDETKEKPQKAPHQKQAIYVLPGYLGSKLYDLDDSSKEIWANVSELVLDIGRFNVGAVPKLYQDDDTQIQVITNSALDRYGTQDTYRSLIERLEDEFSETHEIVFFPYNWLGDLNESVEKLEQDINNKGYDSVSFVTHSTGGLLVSAYISNTLSNDMKTQHQMIDKVILLAPPLLGTYSSLEPLEFGKTLSASELLEANNVPSILHPVVYKYFKSITHNSPTTYQLLPSEEYLNNLPAWYSMSYDISGENMNPILYADVFYETINKSSSINTTLTNGGDRSHKYFRESVLNNNIVDVLKSVDSTIMGCSYLSDELTPSNVIYEKWSEISNFSNPNLIHSSIKDVVYTHNGDSTVLDISSNPSSELNYIELPNTDHMQLINNIKVFNNITNIIRNGSSPTQVMNTSSSSISTMNEELKFNVSCNTNINISVLDSSSDVVAHVEDGLANGFEENGFLYSPIFADDNKNECIIYIPKTGYKIQFFGRENESENIDFNVDISLLNEEGYKSKTVSFSEDDIGEDGTIISIDMTDIVVNEDNLNELVTSANLFSSNNYLNNWNIESFKTLSNIGDMDTIALSGDDVTNGEITAQSLNWMSSNESVVEVSEAGTILAKGYGKALVYAFCKDGGQKSLSCEVTVPLCAESVQIDDIEIVSGERFVIKPVFNSDRVTETDIEYEYDVSSNVVSIDQFGVVRGMDIGEVNVTAVAPGGATTSFNVKVKGRDAVYASNIVMASYEYVKDIDVEFEVSASVEPFEAVNKDIDWSISDSSVAIIESFSSNSCTLRSVGCGNAVLTASIDNGEIISTTNIYVESSNNVSVHYHNSKGWDKPYVYYKAEDNSTDNWTVSPMISEGDGWYIYTVKNTDRISALFYNNESEQNVSEDNAYSISGEKWIIKDEIKWSKPNGVKVHYYCVNNWLDPHIYYYNDLDQELPFPGEKMSPDGGNNWYTYTIYGVDNPRVIFNNNLLDPDNRQQHPGINQPGIEITNDEMWVVNETAYEQKPEGITVHFYRPFTWEPWNTRIYFYEDDNILMDWPGVNMNNPNDNWMTYTIYGVNNPRVLFNDSRDKQIPGVLQPGHLVTQDIWYKGGNWTTYKPID